MVEAAQTGGVKTGILTAVGVGPGDPELLTLKGVRILREADVILTPVGDRSDTSIALSIVAEHIDRSCQEVLTRVFPMRQPAAEMAAAWQSIAAEIAELVHNGKRVAFVTLGDPMFYSTYLYLQQELQTSYPDVPVASVPGVSSILAAAGKSGITLGLGEDILSVVPATLPDEKIREAIDSAGTVVLLKVYRTFDRLRVLLEQAGLAKNAVYIKRLGLEGEEVIRDLGEVSEADLDYLSLVLVRRETVDA